MSTNEARVLATFLIWAAVACILIFSDVFGRTAFSADELETSARVAIPAILGFCAWMATKAVWSSRDKDES